MTEAEIAERDPREILMDMDIYERGLLFVFVGVIVWLILCHTKILSLFFI